MSALTQGSKDRRVAGFADKNASRPMVAALSIAGMAVAGIAVTTALSLILSSEAFMDAQAAMFRAMAVMAEVCRI